MHHSNEERISNIEKRCARLEGIVANLCAHSGVSHPPVVAPLSGGGPGEEHDPPPGP